MNTEQQIHQVELTIEEAKKQINKMNALIRLTNNKDYKEIFMEGFFKEYAVNQVMLRADPSQQSDADQETLLKNIDSISRLWMHLNSVITMGRRAEEAMEDYENTRQELLEEDAA